MNHFAMDLGLREALGLYLSIREDDTRVAVLRERLRVYLYGELSIEEMEAPEAHYLRMVNQALAGPRSSGGL